jgi:hypothetical protein
MSRKRPDRAERIERVERLDRAERRGAVKEPRRRVVRADPGAPPRDDAPPARGSSFRCHHCHRDVPTDALGTQHRNHCPFCLWSRHVDVEPGDRASDCMASMEPIAISVRKDGEWLLIHRCNGCGTLDSNRTAGDDNPLLLLRIAVKPLAQPPFPLDRLAEI